MITTTSPTNESKRGKELIADSAIKLISRYGFEQLTLDQIAVMARVKRFNIVSGYGSLGNLMRFCLQNSLDSLSRYISSPRSYLHDGRLHKTEEFWKLLVAFNSNHPDKASVLCRYLKSPSIFIAQDFKGDLMHLLNPIYDGFEQSILKNSNVHIRFASFRYLYQTACTFADRKSSPLQLNDVSSLNSFYQNKVAPELERILLLPIS